MGVYLGSTYVFVPEHTLDDAEVGPPLEQMGGKGVAEGVGADGLREACLFGQLLDDMEHGDARHTFPEVGTHEEVVLVSGLDVYLGPVGEVGHDLGNGPVRDGYEPLLAAFTLDLDVALLQVEVRELEAACL